MPVKPLSPGQKDEAEALRALFKQWQGQRKDEGLPWSQDWASDQLGFGQSAMNQYLNGKIPLNPDVAVKFTALLGVPVRNFSTTIADEIEQMTAGLTPHATGKSKGSMDLAQSLQPVVKADAKGGDFLIPQYAAGGSMGDGLILEEKQPGLIKSWHVDYEWLRLNVKNHTGIANLCIVTGFGPSMRPKYNPGDPLLLDRGVTAVETEGIFFFRIGKNGFIKQLQRIPTENGLIIRAKSLNKDYDPFDITAKMDFEVFGKVLTVWRSEQV